tara:strand:- start:2443 stop:4326 length:1884 start_codon:yes stop_codon:yes gene_type:complete
MAIRIPIITDLQDKGIRDAKKAFGDFKTSVNNAEGGLDKFKAGSKSIFDAVQANAVTFGVAAGAALFSFAKAGVEAFQDLALSAGKFSDATGLAVEDASRYIEAAGDIGVPIDKVEVAIGKLNKTIGADPDKVRDLGVDLVYLKDGSLDVNETFLNTIQRIKDIKDPAEKARVAAQLLGKGWQGMAELIELGADDLRASLDSVSESKVIDEKELANAKEYRDTMDTLRGVFEDISLAVGQQLIPLLTDAASWLEKISTYKIGENTTLGWIFKLGKWNIDRTLWPFKKIAEAVEAITGSGKDAEVLPETMRAAADETDRFNRAALNKIPVITNTFDKLRDKVEEVAVEMSADSFERFYEVQKKTVDVIRPDRIDNFRLKLDGLAGVMSADTWERFMTTLDDPIIRILPDRLERVQVAAKDVWEEVRNIDQAWKDLTGTLETDVAIDTAKISLNDLSEAAAKAFSTGAQEDIFAYRELLLQATTEIANLAEGMDDASSRQVKILVDKGDLEGALTLIEKIKAFQKTYANVSDPYAAMAGAANIDLSGLKFKAAGGPVMAGGSYIVGERGPELFTPSSSGNITPNNALGGGANITVNVNGGDPNQVVAAIQRWVRDNGAIPMTTTTAIRR